MENKNKSYNLFFTKTLYYLTDNSLTELDAIILNFHPNLGIKNIKLEKYFGLNYVF